MLTFSILLCLLSLPLKLAQIRHSSYSFQINFPDEFKIDVMDSYIIGNCLHMSLYINSLGRGTMIDRLRGLIFEDQKNMKLFSIKSKDSIHASRVFTHKNGKVLEDFELCDQNFLRPLAVAIICPNSQKKSSSDPKKYFIFRLYRGLDDFSLAYNGFSLSSYLDNKNVLKTVPNDVTTCTVASLKNLKFLKLWVEYHRVLLWNPKMTIYVLVSARDILDSPAYGFVLSSEAIEALKFAETQKDIEIIEW